MNSPAQDSQNPDSSSPDFPSQRTSVWKRVIGAVVLAVLFTLAVFVVSSGADYLMLHEHETPRRTIELSDAVSSAVIGLLAYELIRVHQQRRQRLRQRLEIIANMNHHVRNALQVISLSSHGKNREEISAIRESVNRIQWALRELLPKI